MARHWDNWTMPVTTAIRIVLTKAQRRCYPRPRRPRAGHRDGLRRQERRGLRCAWTPSASGASASDAQGVAGLRIENAAVAMSAFEFAARCGPSPAVGCELGFASTHAVYGMAGLP